jgi:hypothetical protein
LAVEDRKEKGLDPEAEVPLYKRAVDILGGDARPLTIWRNFSTDIDQQVDPRRVPKLNDSADVIDVPEDEADRVEKPRSIPYPQQQQELARLCSRLAEVQRIGHFPKQQKLQAERKELQRRARDAEERADEARTEAAGARKEAEYFRHQAAD